MLLRLALSVILLSSTQAEEKHWAYHPPSAHPVPAQHHPVDSLLQAAWDDADLTESPLADPSVWLERAAYTLTGLPPTHQQLQRLAANPDDATWKSLIDELLASPAYGERWARHWMDVARYADTWGYNFQKDNRYPHSYTYRDWLIRAFNDDLPFDQFIKLQIAADHLVPSENDPHLAALGFLTVGPRHGTVETIDDRVDVITRGFLSSTISCARCHDHKTDPFSQQDYYSFYSILENTQELKPIIGKPQDEKAAADFNTKKNDLLHKNHLALHKVVERLRSEKSIAANLEVVWLDHTEKWTSEKFGPAGVKRGVNRIGAMKKWREFLNRHAWGDKPSPRLKQWLAEMDQAADKTIPCKKLASEWASSLDKDNELGRLAKNPGCPLSYDVHRVPQFFNQSDGNMKRDREGAMAKLEANHPGAPPKAMALNDRKKWAPAQIYKRGNRSDRGEPFDRHWPVVLGGDKYTKDSSPRLQLAEKIAAPDNPLTARVMVNRVWAWHFGNPLADQGDFGPQQPTPKLQALLDTLAVTFVEQGWSVKDLHRLILSSQAFRLSSAHSSKNVSLDEANTLFWRWSPQRLDFESARDRILLSSGALNTTTTGGRSVDLSSPSSNHRRSLYAFLDRFVLPGIFLNFDVPHPDHHAPRRIQTTVPQQALYFLNNTLPVHEAANLAKSTEFKNLPDAQDKINWLYQHIHRRPPTGDELSEITSWINNAPDEAYAPPLRGFWQVRHRPASNPADLKPFPLFHEGAWKTGKDVEKAPIPYLHVAPKSGHASHTHDLVLRWVSQGKGSVRLTGSVKRIQKGGGTPLSIDLAGPNDKHLSSQPLAPLSEISLNGPAIEVNPGDTLDFIVRAPTDAAFGGLHWDLTILGREEPQADELELSTFAKDFPKNNTIPPQPPNADPWADVIQALWASNEFHFIH